MEDRPIFKQRFMHEKSKENKRKEKLSK